MTNQETVKNPFATIADVAAGAGTPADNSVSTVKIQNAAVTVPKLSGTGTPSASTFYRGDAVWAVPPGGAGGIQYVVAPTGVAATDTAAIQAAHDALPANGGELRLQAGFYALTATGVTFSKTVRLIGVSPTDTTFGNGTALFSNAINATAVTVSSNACVFEDLAIINLYKSTGAVTSGTGLLLQNANLTQMNRCFVFGYFNNVDVLAGGYWNMTNCTILSPFNYGVRIRNSINVDTGDMVLDTVKFDTTGHIANPVSAVRWESGAGLRIVNCKFNGNTTNTGGNYQFATHIDCAFNGTTAGAGDMFIQNNSLENASSFCINLSRTAGSQLMSNAMIQGNEFQNAPTCVQVGPGWVNSVISGNLFDSGTTGINLLASSGPTVVQHNVFGSGVTTSTSISGSVATGTKVYPQTVFGTSPQIVPPAPYSDISMGNVAVGGTLDLGNATDTTVSRMEAGLIGVEGVYIPTITGAKKIAVVTALPGSPAADTVYISTDAGAPRVAPAITSSATPAINTDAYEFVTITALAVAITSMSTSLTGTPHDGQQLRIRIKDNGTPRAITWGASFEAGSVALPPTTVAGKTLLAAFIYDAVDLKWACEAAASRP